MIVKWSSTSSLHKQSFIVKCLKQNTNIEGKSQVFLSAVSSYIHWFIWTFPSIGERRLINVIWLQYMYALHRMTHAHTWNGWYSEFRHWMSYRILNTCYTYIYIQSTYINIYYSLIFIYEYMYERTCIWLYIFTIYNRPCIFLI